MICLTLVNSIEDIARAGREIENLLSMRCKKRQENLLQHHLGIWVHRRMTVQPPSCLVRTTTSGVVCRYKLVQTASLLGIWTLCWLEPVPPAPSPPSQQELFNCLRATAGEDAENGLYLPLYTSGLNLAEALTLRNTNPKSVHPPLFWDSEKSRFSRVRLVRQTPRSEKQSG
ncbi:hypothetical protein H4684_002149 [Desulfomicrobium macestii]|uniref:Uncharacterized protein n=1 Tax=Desulfomicrobium macestii TaxID=90731 RepID=A0ABR9H465_9BACT|nr:hypothetical protein [Desulfomicrobium macestii]